MDKVYLITGASSDIGIAFIKRIYKPGDIVLAQCFSNVSALKELKYNLKWDIRIFQYDLSSNIETKNLIEEIKISELAITHFIHLPALQLVNVKFTKFDEERFEKDLNIQVRSVIALCKVMLPIMAKKGFGRILFMLSSYLIGVPPKYTAAYAMTKSSLLALAKSLAIDYADKGITVNSVMPGMIETKFLENTPALIINTQAEKNPMKRNAQVSDIVPAMEFLISDDAAFITGVVLPINGGSTMM